MNQTYKFGAYFNVESACARSNANFRCLSGAATGQWQTIQIYINGIGKHLSALEARSGDIQIRLEAQKRRDTAFEQVLLLRR